MPAKARRKAPSRPAKASEASIRTKMAQAKEAALRGEFLALCRRVGIPEPEAEARFDAFRAWRFDFAWMDWPRSMVALEVEGGIWTQGRHTRGKGVLADMEKYNEAAIKGWKVLRCTPDQLLDYSTLKLIARALGLPALPPLGSL